MCSVYSPLPLSVIFQIKDLKNSGRFHASHTFLLQSTNCDFGSKTWQGSDGVTCQCQWMANAIEAMKAVPSTWALSYRLDGSIFDLLFVLHVHCVHRLLGFAQAAVKWLYPSAKWL